MNMDDMKVIPSPRHLHAAVSNIGHKLLYGRVADLRPMPTQMIGDEPRCSVYRYRPPKDVIPTGPPVLLIPPLASPASCYDLRRGCSLAEHLVGTGRRAYLLDYGMMGFADRAVGLEEWIGEVMPQAIRAVSADADGQPVQLVGWCLGGIFSLLAAADQPELPISSITSIAAPVDTTAMPMTMPLRQLTWLTRGAEATLINMVFGGLPQPVVKRAYQLVGIDKYLLRPFVILANLHNAEFLAQMEAVDHFTNTMIAYPGRTFGQVYRQFFRANGLMNEGIEIGGRRIGLDAVRVPVLVIAGHGDGIAPVKAVHALTRRLAGSPEVRFETAPGGHLGVLTGRRARATTWAHLDTWLDEGTRRHGLRSPRGVPVATIR
ncbi:MAG: poly[(R)-3-hydroxyalkanoate] polymerase subunit PhaC [Streptosporangiaceae bacterium]|jgi:polyhydroxyalkanoate synthase|nr:alpha/beta hydrolase [Streptosporangiaceae bacterium]MDX6430783.1 poly[(R)-3-hydroxyalkanoate] polymerase subunit PhaC [Streptosporangiaceae bacterium]